MSTEWLGNIDSGRVSEVLLVDGWHSIDVPSFTVSPADGSFSFDETLAHTHTSSRTRVVSGPLSAVLAISYRGLNGLGELAVVTSVVTDSL